jgi:hypothetical protein
MLEVIHPQQEVIVLILPATIYHEPIHGQPITAIVQHQREKWRVLHQPHKEIIHRQTTVQGQLIPPLQRIAAPIPPVAIPRHRELVQIIVPVLPQEVVVLIRHQVQEAVPEVIHQAVVVQVEVTLQEVTVVVILQEVAVVILREAVAVIRQAVAAHQVAEVAVILAEVLVEAADNWYPN